MLSKNRKRKQAARTATVDRLKYHVVECCSHIDGPGGTTHGKGNEFTGLESEAQSYKASRGYRGRRSKLFRYAKDAQMKASWHYATKDTERDFRSPWITRSMRRELGVTYGGFEG